MLSQEELEALKAKHVDVERVAAKSGKWEVVFRRPTLAEYKQFRSRGHNPATAADAQETLARQTVVYPSREAFDALLQEFPAIPEAASKAFHRLLETEVEEDSK